MTLIQSSVILKNKLKKCFFKDSNVDFLFNNHSIDDSSIKLIFYIILDTIKLTKSLSL